MFLKVKIQQMKCLTGFWWNAYYVRTHVWFNVCSVKCIHLFASNPYLSIGSPTIAYNKFFVSSKSSVYVLNCLSTPWDSTYCVHILLYSVCLGKSSKWNSSVFFLCFWLSYNLKRNDINPCMGVMTLSFNKLIALALVAMCFRQLSHMK